jgi:hypothetical protein
MKERGQNFEVPEVSVIIGFPGGDFDDEKRHPS